MELNKEEKDAITYVLEAMATIKKKHSVKTEWENPTGTNEGVQGIIECPKCKGKLHYSVASFNGHIWGKCETENCLSWMQ